MNKLKGIILVVSICFASIMMPFNISADTITSANIIGTTVNLINTTKLDEREVTVASGTRMAFNNLFTYDVEVQLDNNYVGYLDLSISGSYYHNLNSLTTMSFSYRRKVFINGDKVNFSIDINTWYATDPLLRNAVNATPSVTLNDSGVTLISELDSIDQIINILDNLYNSNDQVEGLLNDQLQQLQLIVFNTSLANQYLDSISKFRQWHTPYESFQPILYLLNRYPIQEFNTYYDFNYPFFNLVPNNTMIQAWNNTSFTYEYIFFTNQNIQYGNFSNYLSVEDTSGGNVIPQIGLEEIMPVISGYKLIKITYKPLTNTNYRIRNLVNCVVSPIYYGVVGSEKVSTDFALVFNLSNRLLDNLDKIANGTTASNSASQQLDSDTSDFNTDRDDLIDIEDTMGNNMDSAMNQITPNNNGLSEFGGNFLTSAVWVRTQFERLTNNTPYGSLIVYGMTLGLALLLLGKVML